MKSVYMTILNLYDVKIAIILWQSDIFMILTWIFSICGSIFKTFKLIKFNMYILYLSFIVYDISKWSIFWNINKQKAFSMNDPFYETSVLSKIDTNDIFIENVYNIYKRTQSQKNNEDEDDVIGIINQIWKTINLPPQQILRKKRMLLIF